MVRMMLRRSLIFFKLIVVADFLANFVGKLWQIVANCGTVVLVLLYTENND